MTSMTNITGRGENFVYGLLFFDILQSLFVSMLIELHDDNDTQLSKIKRESICCRLFLDLPVPSHAFLGDCCSY
jgi:hypothetical protein